MHLKILLTTVCTLTFSTIYASEHYTCSECVSPVVTSADTLSLSPDTVPLNAAAAKRKGIIARVIEYFEDSNKPKKDKKFDFSVIGGPHYSSDTKFGIGLVAAGIYRSDTTHTDSVYMTPESNVAIYADATTSMFFKLGIRGTHIFKDDLARMRYDVNFASIASKFWGIGYENNINNDNESRYKYLCSDTRFDYIVRVAENLYIGPTVAFNYVNGHDFRKPWLLEGENRRTFNLGVGFTAEYDTRDCLTAATRGWYIRLDQRFNPRLLFNKYSFSLTEVNVSGFWPAWRGAIIAAQVHGRITYGNTPWGLLSTLGGSNNMRGYFEGRYRDKSEIDACLELRQHVWRRNGIVLWVGAGTVFPRFSAFRWNHVLPNYGIGYRWEFKKRMNVRLDLGFGRHQTGFIFSINEAF